MSPSAFFCHNVYYSPTSVLSRTLASSGDNPFRFLHSAPRGRNDAHFRMTRQRDRFRYPELRVDWRPSGAVPFTRRAWAKCQAPGVYATTVTAGVPSRVLAQAAAASSR
jgi:hypothetical protein